MKKKKKWAQPKFQDDRRMHYLTKWLLLIWYFPSHKHQACFSDSKVTVGARQQFEAFTERLQKVKYCHVLTKDI